MSSVCVLFDDCLEYMSLSCIVQGTHYDHLLFNLSLFLLFPPLPFHFLSFSLLSLSLSL